MMTVETPEHVAQWERFDLLDRVRESLGAKREGTVDGTLPPRAMFCCADVEALLTIVEGLRP